MVITLSLLLLSACTSLQKHNIEKMSRHLPKKYTNLNSDAQKKLTDYKKIHKQIKKEIKSIRTLYANLEENIDKIWGKNNRQVPQRKKYVKYTENYRDRAYIDFEKGIVNVETLATDAPLAHLKKTIVTTLLTPNSANDVDIFSAKNIPDLNLEPFLYQQVLDQNKQPIRWKWRAQRYAQNLIDNKLKIKTKNGKKIYSVEFDLVKNSEEIRSYKYSGFVQAASKRYNIKESLIYAIIKTESSFNPYAVSHANAYGLMQVIPSTAGKDVFSKIKKRSDTPTKNYLFSAQNNIDTGTAYLHILKTRYLKGIKNDTGRHYAIISAYNGGSGNVFKTFSYDRENALKVINKKNSQQVYNDLHTKNPISEARHYLYKVHNNEKEFLRAEL